MNNSNLFELNWKDFINGLVMAVLGNVVMYLMIIFSELFNLVINGNLFVISINWQAIYVVAIFSALTYLSKRFISNPSNTILEK